MDTVDGALLAYRDHPTNLTFDRAYRPLCGWLHATAGSIVRSYPALDPSVDSDDVCSEGTLALFHAARRYVYFCGECGKVFLHGGDLDRHGVCVHRRCGCASTLSISQFSRESARLAMRRTANRLVTPYDLDDELEVSFDARTTERLTAVEDLYGRLRDRLEGMEASVREQVVAYLLGDSNVVNAAFLRKLVQSGEAVRC